MNKNISMFNFCNFSFFQMVLGIKFSLFDHYIRIFRVTRKECIRLKKMRKTVHFSMSGAKTAPCARKINAFCEKKKDFARWAFAQDFLRERKSAHFAQRWMRAHLRAKKNSHNGYHQQRSCSQIPQIGNPILR